MSDNIKKVILGLIFFSGGAISYELLNPDEEEENTQKDLETEKREINDYENYMRDLEKPEKIIIQIDQKKLVRSKREIIIDALKSGSFVVGRGTIIIGGGIILFKISKEYYSIYQFFLLILKKLSALSVLPFKSMLDSVYRLIEYIKNIKGGVARELEDINKNPNKGKKILDNVEKKLSDIAEKLIKTPMEEFTVPPSQYKPYFFSQKELNIPVQAEAPEKIFIPETSEEKRKRANILFDIAEVKSESEEEKKKRESILFGYETFGEEKKRKILYQSDIMQEELRAQKKLNIVNEIQKTQAELEHEFLSLYDEISSEDIEVRVATPENLIISNENNENLSINENTPAVNAFESPAAQININEPVRQMFNPTIIEQYNNALRERISDIFDSQSDLPNILTTVITMENKTYYTQPSNPHIYIGDLKNQTPDSYFRNIIKDYENVISLLNEKLTKQEENQNPSVVVVRNIKLRIKKIQKFVDLIKALKEIYFANL